MIIIELMNTRDSDFQAQEHLYFIIKNPIIYLFSLSSTRCLLLQIIYCKYVAAKFYLILTISYISYELFVSITDNTIVGNIRNYLKLLYVNYLN
jgi:hypothetical protein